MEIAELGFGTAPLGGLFARVSEGEAQAALAAAFEAGVRVYDTAPHYGGGLAEERLGRFLATVDARACRISTKVGRMLGPADDAGPPDRFEGGHRVRRSFDFSRDGILRSLEESLSRLHLDRVDTLYLHDPESAMTAALDSGLGTLHELKGEGVVDAVGVGTNLVPVARRFLDEGAIDAVMLAGRLTLLDQSAAELAAQCVVQSVRIDAAGVFNSGVLADPSDGARFDYRPAPPEILAAARTMSEACARHGVSLSVVASRYPSLYPAVTSTIVGLRSAREVWSAVAGARVVIPDELWRSLERLGVHLPAEAGINMT